MELLYLKGPAPELVGKLTGPRKAHFCPQRGRFRVFEHTTKPPNMAHGINGQLSLSFRVR